MKVSINSKLRKILIAVSILIFMISGFIAFREYGVEEYEKVEREVLDYSIEPNIKFKFNLVPNIIYDKAYLTEEDIIIDKMVASVIAEPEFNIKTQKGERIDATITLEQSVDTFYGSENILMWSKALDPIETNVSGSGELNYTKQETLNLSYFQNFLAQAIELTEISGNSIYTSKWDIKGFVYKGDLEMPIDESFRVNLPMGVGVYTVDKSNFSPIQKSITETDTQQIPINFALIWITLVIMIFAVLGFIILVFLAKNKSELSTFDKYKKEIFSSYEERLAKLERTFHSTSSKQIGIKTIEDMVKIADEIRQPIFYSEIDTPNEKKLEFFIFDENRNYYLAYCEEYEEPIDNTLSV